MRISRVGAFSLGWGESLVWDDVARRLYFADCAAQTIHWLEDGQEELHTFQAPSMPAGLVPTTGGRLVAILDDGIYDIDVDAGSAAILTPFPEQIGGRCNDACADLDGNLITGRLNLGPEEGSAWWYSRRDGWRLLDDDISNTNGPAALVIDGVMTLIIGDTSAEYFAYPYDGATGTVGPRRVFGDTEHARRRPRRLDRRCRRGPVVRAVRWRTARPLHRRGPRSNGRAPGREPDGCDLRRRRPRSALRDECGRS